SPGLPPRTPLDVETNVEHISLLDHVGLPFEALEAAPSGLRVRAGLDEVVPADHLAADEPAGEVRVDRRGGVECRLTTAQDPGARLLLAGGEEADQAELLAEPADNVLQGRRALAEAGGMVAELGQLGLELQVDSLRTVLERQQRLRRQRLELGRKLSRPVGERPAGV